MPDELPIWIASLLGLVQGLTEFLPVSSSGHIAIGAMFFEVPEPLSLSVVLHFGTLLATILAMRADLIQLVRALFGGLKEPKAFFASEEGKTIVGVVLASIPTAVLGLLMKDHVESWSAIPAIVGTCLLITALALVLTRREGKERTLSIPKAIAVGVVQGLAVLPGISRSGSTIATAMLLGLDGERAFRFSFLLSLPAVSGAVVLLLGKPGALSGVSLSAWIGGAIAFGVGYVSLILLKGIVTRGRLWLFAVYLVPLGLALIGWQFV